MPSPPVEDDGRIEECPPHADRSNVRPSADAIARDGFRNLNSYLNVDITANIAAGDRGSTSAMASASLGQKPHLCKVCEKNIYAFVCTHRCDLSLDNSAFAARESPGARSLGAALGGLSRERIDRPWSSGQGASVLLLVALRS